MKFAIALVMLSAVIGFSHCAAAASPAFAEQAPPAAPDYAKPASWAARAGHPGATASVPPGASPLARKPAVDVFYVHPTTYKSKEHWNQDITDAETNAWTDASVMARQASVFNGCCRIFAPRYRQASIMSLSSMAGDGGHAFDLAYSDVERAFDYYLQHDNHGRPFILASHSQGSFHLARLLEQKIDGTPLAQRMVAAYIIGFNLSEGDFPKTYQTIPVCATPTQTGCVVGWNAVLDGDDLAARAAFGEQRYVQRYGDDAGKTMLCINPLTFARSMPTAAASHSLGAVPGAPGAGPLLPLRAAAVSARCEYGELVVQPLPELDLQPLPGGSMHFHDFGLFYADVRANAALRVASFLRSSKHK